jgi:CHAT domain-containing protein/tetratricopeptide (TPR) repeat protein
LDLAEFVDPFLRAKNWLGWRSLVHRYPQVLAPLSEPLLRLLASAQSDAPDRAKIDELISLLDRCRQIGIDEAFIEAVSSRRSPFWGPFSAPPPPVPPELQNELAEAAPLYEKLEAHPELRPELVRITERMLAQVGNRYPKYRAQLLQSLASLYRGDPAGSVAENLERAGRLLDAAISLLDVETDPIPYAIAHNTRGLVDMQAQRGDRIANVESAIWHFEEAQLVAVFVPQMQELYVKVANNLGIAARILPKGDLRTRLRRSIKYYEDGLKGLRPSADPRHAALLHRSLGNAYQGFPTGDTVKDLARAKDYYELALQVYRPKTAPLQYAGVMNNLGEVYRKTPGEFRAENRTRAIECYSESLKYAPRNVAPLDYALTQNNLGLLYAEEAQENCEVGIEKAVECYRNALEVFSSAVTPFDFRRTNRNLGNLYFANERWEEASSAYQAAINAGEELYRLGLSEESKSVELAENHVLYNNAAFVAAKLNRSMEALLILGRGKARLLEEALAHRTPRPQGLSDQSWQRFAKARDEARWLSLASATESYGLRPFGDREHAPLAARRELDAAIAEVRESDPNFLKRIQANELESLCPDSESALVQWCVTDKGSLGFALTRRQQPALSVIDIPGFSTASLRKLMLSDGITSSQLTWMDGYRRLKRDPSEENQEFWRAVISSVLAQIGGRLIRPVIDSLPENVRHLVFCPTGALFLLPLHAAPISAESRVCDRFDIRYAPSFEVLARLASERRTCPTSLYAVVNDDGAPLPFAKVEAESVAAFFSHTRLDSGADATLDRVLAGLGHAECAHFACHGLYDWNTPRLSHLALADGTLTLADLMERETGRTTARLVMLSACETGVSDVFLGSPDEFVGLPAGFMLAGFPCVVSSLWPVSDAATALLTEKFYMHYVVEVKGAAEALRAAGTWLRELTLVQMLESADRLIAGRDEGERERLLPYLEDWRAVSRSKPGHKPFSHPYYWAAFTVHGG